MATVLAQLTCYKGVLPQGAPTSPIITNFICRILDNRLLKIAKKYKLDYTRYADDLSFSTNDKHFIELYKIFIDELKEEIEHSGFHINDKKTRLLFKDSRQTVTGLIVNKNLNVSQEYYRKTRAMAHALYVKGTFTIDGKDGTLNQLEGRFSFINQLVLYNNKLNGEKHTLKTLTGREREFQRFLFYKYFYCNDYPIIMTEGKTDIRYLKAALKTLHASYPNLIEKEVNDKFKFYIYFFKRTKRIKYFLGLHDGGDNLGSICNYFISMEKDTYPNYFEYFSNIGIYPQKPIILLFDNELESNRPLKKFITKFAKERIHELKNNLWIKLKEEMNIYIVTNDLVDNLEECEIEQLFPEEIRNHKIGGKTFCLKEKEFSPQKNYGKEIFSSYIMSQRDEEVFSGFRDVLNRINSIVTSYTPYAIKNT